MKSSWEMIVRSFVAAPPALRGTLERQMRDLIDAADRADGVTIPAGSSKVAAVKHLRDKLGLSLHEAVALYENRFEAGKQETRV